MIMRDLKMLMIFQIDAPSNDACRFALHRDNFLLLCVVSDNCEQLTCCQFVTLIPAGVEEYVFCSLESLPCL
jgi:hypothetical protein